MIEIQTTDAGERQEPDCMTSENRTPIVEAVVEPTTERLIAELAIGRERPNSRAPLSRLAFYPHARGHNSK